MTTPAPLQDSQARFLSEGLRELFGELNEEMMSVLTPMLAWQEVAGGELVVREGDTSDDLYFIISGRLRAYQGEEAQRRFLNEMGRGETIGEVAFFTKAPRSATVIAIRDTVLVRMVRPDIEKLLENYPQVVMNMARLIIARLNRANDPRRKQRRPVNICLLPVSPLPAGITVQQLGTRLVSHLARSMPALLLTADNVASRLGIPGAANVEKSQGDQYRHLTRALDELESRHEQVVYVPGDDPESEWSQRCLRMADRVLLLADAAAVPELSHAEARFLTGDGKITQADQVLVLLHPGNKSMPSGTHAWLESRSFLTLAGHVHIRPELDRDLARLARIQSGRAIGLVFSGAGARSFAHLGVYKALREFGIAVDLVGGTGIGAVMAALVALDMPADEIIGFEREFFRSNPTGDISFMPLTSLVKGQVMQETLNSLFESVAGADARIEDTWKTFFCIASNYSRHCETVIRRGSLAKSLRASCAVPGLLPPIPISGDLMVDGGAFNNFPTDVMAQFGADKIIGVNLVRDHSRAFTLDEIPSGWVLLKDQLTGNRREFEVPALLSILMNSTTLYSASREQASEAMLDLGIKLNLRSVGMLDWHKANHAINVGYKRARKILSELTPDQLGPLTAAS